MAVFLGCNSTGQVGLCFLWFFVQELRKAQPAVVLVLKRLRRRGNGLKTHPTDWEKPGIESATPGLQDIGLSPTPFCGFPGYKPVPPGWFKISVGLMSVHRKWFYGEAANRTRDPWFTRQIFVAFLGINQFHWVDLRFVYWFYVGNTQRLTESGSMEKEKRGIEPATPGLQGIFVAFLGIKQNSRAGLDLCWFYVGNTLLLTKSGFTEKPRIKPATPGLQGKFFVAFLGINKFHRVD